MTLPKLMLDAPQEGYTVTDGGPVLGAKMSSGPSRIRLDQLDACDVADLTFVLSPVEYQYWRAFFVARIVRGSLPFLCDLLLDSQDVYTYQVQMMPGSLSTSVQGSAHLVMFQAEIIPDAAAIPADPDTIVTLFETYGAGLEFFFNELEYLVNTVMPRDLA